MNLKCKCRKIFAISVIDFVTTFFKYFFLYSANYREIIIVKILDTETM